MIKVIISLVIIYILNIIDYFQTTYAVSLAGIGVEANPIGRIMLESGYGWIVKLIVVPIVLIILGATINTARKQSWVVYLLLVFDFVVIINNFIVLFRLGGISMNTILIVCAVITTLSAMATGVLLALYKHEKKKNKK